MQNVNAAQQGNREIQAPFYSLGLGSGVEGVHQLPQNGHDGSAGAFAGQGYGHNGAPQMQSCAVTNTQSNLHPSRGAAFHEGHPEEGGGYFEEPMSVGDLTSLEDTFSNANAKAEGLTTQWDPPPPEPPRPFGGAIAGATTRPMALQQPPPPPPSASFPLQQPEGPQVCPAASFPAVPEATTAMVTQADLAAAPAAAAPPAAAPSPAAMQNRDSWRQGSILEIYSGSTGRWYPSLLLRVQRGEGTPDVLTMQFWLNAGDAKQKSLYRNDYQQLMPLGSNLEGELPAGFCLKPSQSRPGHSVFQDMTTGMKYQTAELAWQTHFQRLLEQPSATGQETVAHLASSHSMSTLQQHGYASGKQEYGHAPAAGLTTEYGSDVGQAGQAMTSAAEGLSTEYGPASQQRKQLQQLQAASPAEKRWQSHGAQLAAEVAGRRLPSGPSTAPLHQYNTMEDCRRGASGAPVSHNHTGERGPMAVV
jgi:hypothetical protein